MGVDVTIKRGRSYSTADAGDNRDLLYKLLDEVCSYPIPGAEFSEKYITGVWDGRARLHNRPRGKGVVRFPSGLVDQVADFLRGKRWAIGATAAPLCPRGALLGRWVGYAPRDYQKAAIRAFLAGYDAAVRDPTLPPGGILRMPVRSGKTLTAAAIAHALGHKVIFAAPSEFLLRQAREAFESCIADASVGQFGLGVKDTEQDIIVATLQTLARAVRTKDFTKLQRQHRFLIIDEVHHKGSNAEVWREAVMRLEPATTLGLSATFELDEDVDPDEKTSMMWLRAICGPVRYSVEIDDLIRRGFLVRTTVDWIETDAPKLSKQKRTPQQLYRDGIVQCMPRNEAIVREAARFANKGSLVLIDAAQVGHTRMLNRMLKGALGSSRVGMLVGSTSVKMRQKVVKAFAEKKLSVIVSTVLGEGVDIPELDVVINAEGGSGYIPTMQRFRCMTKAPGKKKARLVDFIDDHHSTLLAATKARHEVYKSVRAFRFRHRK